MSELTGKRMYRMSDGKMVELPADMSVEEAASLEAEGKAAEKKLGKGPPPLVIPDVKAKAKEKEKKDKSDKKEKPKAKKGTGAEKGGGKKGEGEKGGSGKISIKGKVGAWLLAKGAPAIARGKAKLETLKQNEQKHDDAGTKLGQIEKAVVPPPVEGQSTSNSTQVSAVDAKPVPEPSEDKAKAALDKAIADNIPQNIEDVDNFKRDNKAGAMSSAVALSVNTDKVAVSGTFSDMSQTPPPAPSEVVPEALPPEEVAPVTPKMNLGADTIPPLQPEHTDVSNYTNEADAKLKDEGVTQEQLDMVDSGDLADANKEKKGMEKTAKSEPAAIQKLAKDENKKVDTELQQEETKGREHIKNHRKEKLNATKEKQKGTKSALEKKREEVANKINLIYQKAQDKVTKKLADLETVSMKRFDDGNTEATRVFETTVKSELDAFKDDRYSGFWGWAKKAKDWLLGMEDLPQVKAIFDRNRSIFVSTIGKLVDSISADNKKVIAECKEELAKAKTEIKEYVDKLGPDLKDAGKKAQGEMNDKLEELDKVVNKKEEELQNKLKDKQQAAIKAIDDKIEKMKEAMSGALSKLGKLLLLAAKKFFTWALEKFGFSLSEIEGIINKGAAVLKAIFTKPIQFVKNLMNAAILGFKNFGKNFLKHLKDALFEWLTGSLDGLTLPAVWNFQGIISVGLQMIGISYQNIRKHMVTVMGETVVSGLEKTFKLVMTLITEGPMAAWEQLKEMAGEMRDAFIEAVKDFIKVKIIEQAITWLVGIFIPGAGIIKAIIGIYDTIVFFIQKAKQIMQMISNFLGSIAEIAAGNIGAAADAMENGLARGLSLVINFLAKLLHLDGITSKIKAAIQKIRDKVDAVMLKVAQWIADKAKKLWGGIKSAAGKIVEWWTVKKNFTAQDGHDHELFFENNAEKKLMMASNTPVPVERLLAKLKKDPATDKTKLSQAEALVTKIGAETGAKAGKVGAANRQAIGLVSSPGVAIDAIVDDMSKLAALLKEVVGVSAKKPTKSIYDYSNGPHTVLVTDLHQGNKEAGNPARTESNDVVGSKYINKHELSNVNLYSNFYVRAHVVNHEVGGDGMNAKNLLWVPQKTNKSPQMTSYERATKKLLEDANNLIWITVATQQYWPKLNGPDADGSYSGKTFAKEVLMKTGQYYVNPDGKWHPDNNPRVKETLHIPEPTTPYVPSLSLPSASFLRSVSPKPSKLLDNVATVKSELIVSGGEPFGTLAKFTKRMKDFEKNRIRTNQTMLPDTIKQTLKVEGPKIDDRWDAIKTQLQPLITAGKIKVD
jgi:hypothetical protein